MPWSGEARQALTDGRNPRLKGSAGEADIFGWQRWVWGRRGIFCEPQIEPEKLWLWKESLLTPPSCSFRGALDFYLFSQFTRLSAQPLLLHASERCWTTRGRGRGWATTALREPPFQLPSRPLRMNFKGLCLSWDIFSLNSQTSLHHKLP